jgi:Core-2/I-Branching enzyme
VRLAFLLLTHKEPPLVGRLVHHLTESAHGQVLIHVDAARDISPFVKAAPRDAHVDFLWDRHRVTRGGFSMVRATLSGMRLLANQNSGWDYLVLLSGQHYPIKPIRHLRDYLARNEGKTHIEAFPFPVDAWPSGGLERVERWHFGELNPHGHVRCRLERLARLLPRRKAPGGVSFYAGSQWFAMHRDHVGLVLKSTEERTNLMSFFRFTDIPDEMFFQTILLNDLGAGAIVNEQLTYVDWTQSVKPALLTDSHFNRLAEGPEFFARKFDLSRLGLLERIDANLLARPCA